MIITGWQEAEDTVWIIQVGHTHLSLHGSGKAVLAHSIFGIFALLVSRSSVRDLFLTLNIRCLSITSLLPQPFQFISILISNTAVTAGLGFPLTPRRLPSTLNCTELCSKVCFVFYDVDKCLLEIGDRNSCLLEPAQFKNSTSVKPSLGHMDLM